MEEKGSTMELDDEIIINGEVYVRKYRKAPDECQFKKGSMYFTFHSSDPLSKLKELVKKFPEMNSFFVGKRGYCGRVCLEVDIRDVTVDFLKKLLYVSDSFFNIIEDEKEYYKMVGEEMGRPDLH